MHLIHKRHFSEKDTVLFWHILLILESCDVDRWAAIMALKNHRIQVEAV
jgi:hypothetical protein